MTNASNSIGSGARGSDSASIHDHPEHDPDVEGEEGGKQYPAQLPTDGFSGRSRHRADEGEQQPHRSEDGHWLLALPG